MSPTDAAVLAAVLSFASALVASTVASVTVLSSRQQSREAIAYRERELRAAIIWERRVKVYQDAMAWSGPLLRDLRGETSDRSPLVPPDAFLSGHGVPADLDARFRLFADGDVLASADPLREQFTDTRAVVRALEAFEAQMRHDIDRMTQRRPKF